MTIIPRKAHVKRLSLDASNWIDVFRLDQFEVSTSAGAQRAIVNVKWRDETSENADGREYDVVSVSLPSGGTVDVNAIKKMIVNNSGQISYWSFKNNASNDRRDVKKKRIYGVSGVPDATTPVDWEIYREALVSGGVGSAIGQYIDVEFVDTFDRGNSGQRDTVHFKNEALESLFNNSPVGVDAIRLDPLQVIVNMNAAPEELGTRVIEYLLFANYDYETGSPASTNVFTVGDDYQDNWVASIHVDVVSVEGLAGPWGQSADATISPKAYIDHFFVATSDIDVESAHDIPTAAGKVPPHSGLRVDFEYWAIPVGNPYIDQKSYFDKWTHVTDKSLVVAGTVSIDMTGQLPNIAAFGTEYSAREIIPDPLDAGFLPSGRIVYRRIDLP